MTAAKEPTVTQAIAAVMGELPAIGRDGQASASQGGYAYRGIEQITAAAQGLFAKHGIVFVPEVTRMETKEVTVNNKPWTDTFLHVRYEVFGPNGDSIKVGPLVAIGRDNSDKGANKAMTQAFKYALLQVFCISDAKDDGDGVTHEADVVTVPDEIFWRNFGYDSEEAFQVENSSLRELWRSLPSGAHAGITAWLKEQGYDRPVPVKKEHVDSYRARMQEALVAEPATAAPAPEPDLSITRTTPADVLQSALEALEADLQAMPDSKRVNCRAEIKRTFGEPHEMEIDHVRAARKMVEDWPMADLEKQEAPAPPVRSAKLRGLLAFARGQRVDESELRALAEYLAGSHEPRTVDSITDEECPQITTLIEELRAGKLVIELGTLGPIVKEAQSA